MWWQTAKWLVVPVFTRECYNSEQFWLHFSTSQEGHSCSLSCRLKKIIILGFLEACWNALGHREKSWFGRNVQNVAINLKRMGKAVELSGSMSTDGSSTQSGCILTAAELKCTCARWHFDPRAQQIKECEWARWERVSSCPSLFVRAVPSQSCRPLVQVQLIRECRAGSVQSFLNKTWGSQRGGGAKRKKRIKSNQDRASAAVSGCWYQHSSYSPHVSSY